MLEAIGSIENSDDESTAEQFDYVGECACMVVTA